MDDAVSMRVVESTGDLDCMCQRDVERQRPLFQTRRERVALEELHDEVVSLVMTTDVVQRADVRVREGGNRPGFAGESGPLLFVKCEVDRENLDRHRAIETGVGRAEDLAHAAGTEQTFYAIRAESGTGLKLGRSSSSGAAIDQTDLSTTTAASSCRSNDSTSRRRSSSPPHASDRNASRAAGPTSTARS